MTEPKNIREFIDWAISNQEGLKKENAPSPFPDWNKGYLEALNDCKSKIIYPIDQFEETREMVACKHASDGNLYHVNGLYEIPIGEVELLFSPSEILKCKKCGGFYR